MNLRRLLLILVFAAVVIGIALAIYFVFFRPSGPPSSGNENVSVNGVLPGTNLNVNRAAGTGNVNGLPPITGINVNAGPGGAPTPIASGGPTVAQPITEKPVSETTFAPNGRDLVYFDADVGQFFRFSPSTGSATALSDATFRGAEQIDWSPTRDRAVISFPDDSKIVYDFTTRKQYTLPKEGADFSFSPSGSEIAFKYLPENPDERWIAVSKSDGTEIRLIEPVGEEQSRVDVNWSPTGQVAALYGKGLDATRQEVIPIGLHNENFKSFVVEGRGFESQWSPTGSHLLYSSYSPETSYNPTLNIVEAQGDTIGRNRRTLQLSTWSDKCAFSGNGQNLYCAVPRYLDPGSGLYRETVSAPDDFYQVDLASGRVSFLAQPVTQSGTGSFRAEQLMVSSDGSVLYFRDASTGRLVQMKLR